MGKHERHKAEISEKIITDALKYNDNIINEFRKENYLDLCEIIVDRIQEDYNIKSIEQIGNSYDSIGDIKLINTDSEIIFIEIKITHSGGTLGNITGDALTKYGIVENAKSWSEYRNENTRHYEWVREYLNQYNYPEDVKVDDTKTSIYDRASHLKKEINCGRKNTYKVAKDVLEKDSNKSKVEAAKIIMDIIDRAKDEKIDYINYIQNKNLNEERLRKFTYLLLSGYATESNIMERIDMPINIMDDYDEYDYVVYNGYKKDMSVEKEYKNKRVEILFNEGNIQLEFPENQYGFNIQNNNETLLRGQYHWKNKFNGIQTPCLNIFNKF